VPRSPTGLVNGLERRQQVTTALVSRSSPAATIAHLNAADRLIGAVLAIAAAVWHAMLMTRATNDNFLHLTLAQQWLNGDVPVRDFFDQGWVLQYSLSAAAQLLFGQRLGSEAIVVGLSWSVSTCLVFVIVRVLTGSRMVAIVSALLPIVASARGYSYPKGIVYAVAAWLWWRYVTHPASRRAIALGVWAAIAFYWRPDHGVYVAIAIVLAAAAAHGLRLLALQRCLVAAAVMLVCLAPFLLYVQWMYGLRWYVQTGLVQAEVEHQSHGTHEWPLLRYGTQIVSIEPAGHFAPVVALRWSTSSSERERQEVRARYGLTTVAIDADGTERVRLSPQAVSRVRPLIGEPIVDDTAGIDRSAGTLTEKGWPASRRWKFDHPALRVQILPFLDEQARASEITATMFFLFPLVTLIGAGWLGKRLNVPGPASLAAFAAFALIVAWAMIRNPFPARVADAVVLTSICFGACIGAVWQAAVTRRRTGFVQRSVAALVAVLVVVTVARAGRFDGPWTWFNGAAETYRELTASPPLAFYVGRPARFTLRLAAYVRECVPVEDRVLVLWFEPEIYYYSDRLMAQRHLVFAPAWAALEHEQRATLDKINRFKPPLALMRRSALEEYARATYPGVIAYVTQHYDLAATVQDSGEDYLIYARRDRPAVRTFSSGTWPCYVAQSSPWVRVGEPSR
jgi:hypothetical protein